MNGEKQTPEAQHNEDNRAPRFGDRVASWHNGDYVIQAEPEAQTGAANSYLKLSFLKKPNSAKTSSP